MSRSGAKSVKISFTAGRLTHFGGVFLVHCFLRQFQLRTFLSRRLRLYEWNNRFSVTERILALMYPMILGLHQSIELSTLLGTNGVFQYLTGLPKFPHPNTLRQFLVGKAPILSLHLHTAHNDLRAYFLALPHAYTSYWFDFDSTVRTLYGHQEGVVKGYNPKKKGARSYHPLLCTEPRLGDCLGGRLRYGNASGADGVLEMLDGVLGIIPAGTRDLRARADAGFYDTKFIEKLEENRIGFVVGADMTKPLKHKVQGLRYHRISQYESVADFQYRPHRWPRPYRFVVLRKKITEEQKSQLKLFMVNAYAYHAVVTNLDLTSRGVFQCYGDRSGTMERVIRIAKEDLPFGKAPVHSFEANAMYAELSLPAYNLMRWFQRLCLPEDWQSYTVETLRRRLLLIPGNFTRAHNRPELKLPKNSPYQDTFLYALKRIQKIKPLV
jgi:hypothetical protein